jgi:hypothetical protein
VDQRPTGGVRRLSLCYANLCHIFLGFLRASMGERSVWNWTLLVRALWFMIFMVCAAYSSKISKTFSKCIFWTPVCFFVDILYVSNNPRLNLTSAWCALITLAARFFFSYLWSKLISYMVPRNGTYRAHGLRNLLKMAES